MRSASTPEIGTNLSIGMARTPRISPSRAPESVISYTTQPSAACCTHWLEYENSEPASSSR